MPLVINSLGADTHTQITMSQKKAILRNQMYWPNVSINTWFIKFIVVSK